MSDHVDLGLAVAVGAVVGVGGYALAGPLLAVHLAVVYAILAWLAVNYWAEIPDTDAWAVNRWNGLLTVVLTVAAFGVLNARGVALRSGVAYAALVFGVGYAAFLVALAMVADERAETTATTETGSSVEES